MSSSSGGGGSGHYYDYIPDQVQRYVQRDEFESVHGLPSRYSWNRSRPGFPRSPAFEEPANPYNWNRTQPGFHHSQLEEPANQYNRNRIQTRLPHSHPVEELSVSTSFTCLYVCFACE